MSARWIIANPRDFEYLARREKIHVDTTERKSMLIQKDAWRRSGILSKHSVPPHHHFVSIQMPWWPEQRQSSLVLCSRSLGSGIECSNFLLQYPH